MKINLKKNLIFFVYIIFLLISFIKNKFIFKFKGVSLKYLIFILALYRYVRIKIYFLNYSKSLPLIYRI
jgi:hypothetical protein